MASSSMLVRWSLGGSRAAAACGSSASSTTYATRVFRSAFASVTNNGDAAPVTGSEEDVAKSTGDGRRAADDVGRSRNVKDAAAEAKDAGHNVKDRAKEAAQDVKQTIKETH